MPPTPNTLLPPPRCEEMTFVTIDTPEEVLQKGPHTSLQVLVLLRHRRQQDTHLFGSCFAKRPFVCLLKRMRGGGSRKVGSRVGKRCSARKRPNICSSKYSVSVFFVPDLQSNPRHPSVVHWPIVSKTKSPAKFAKLFFPNVPFRIFR